MSFPPICLTLIVKNESKVIERCLKSTLNFISTYCICDTGSTDNTKEVISEFFKKHKIPGVIHDTPWVNFGVNRSILLEKSREHCPDGYSFMIDADDEACGDIPDKSIFRANNPDGSRKYNAIFVTIKHNSIEHRRVHFFSNKSKWGYRGVLHEYRYLEDDNERSIVMPNKFYINASTTGVRSYDPKKYENDAKILQAEYNTADGKNDPHTVFYLAQSYKDAGNRTEAIKYYKERVILNDKNIGYDQEAYISCYYLVQFMENLEDKIFYAWKGIEITPKRLEAPYYLIKYAREHNIWKQQIYSMCISITNRNIDPFYMFAITQVYDFSFDDEILIYAYYTKHFDDTNLIPVIERLSNYIKTNEFYKSRVLQNISYFPLLKREEPKVQNKTKKHKK
jgi:tetratricopeptide (TPR) repeat protein